MRKTNEYLVELTNGWAWVYAETYRVTDFAYEFLRGADVVESFTIERVKSISENPMEVA